MVVDAYVEFDEAAGRLRAGSGDQRRQRGAGRDFRLQATPTARTTIGQPNRMAERAAPETSTMQRATNRCWRGARDQGWYLCLREPPNIALVKPAARRLAKSGVPLARIAEDVESDVATI